MIVNIFFSILRRFGSYERNTRISDISGIVMVDEIDLHLHTSYQYQNLPKLMKLFPSIQFIVTTHSPFFVLGMEEVFGSDGFCVYEFPLGCQISAEYFGEFEDAFQSMKRTDRFKKEIKDAQEPIVILEGETDKKYLLKASELLGKEDVIRRIELKCGNGFPSLDSIWKRWRKDSIRMILLYDCDCERDDRTDSVVIKNIPKQEGHPIEKGIENLFARKILDEAALKVDKDRIEDLVNYKNGKLGKKVCVCDGYAKTARRKILSILRVFLIFWSDAFLISLVSKGSKDLIALQLPCCWILASLRSANGLKDPRLPPRPPRRLGSTMRGIINPIGRQRLGNHLAGGLVDPHMQFAPSPPFGPAMLADFPLALTIDLQAG